jgi:hypothetical protein
MSDSAPGRWNIAAPKIPVRADRLSSSLERYCSDECRLEAKRWRRWKAALRYRATDNGMFRLTPMRRAISRIPIPPGARDRSPYACPVRSWSSLSTFVNTPHRLKIPPRRRFASAEIRGSWLFWTTSASFGQYLKRRAYQWGEDGRNAKAATRAHYRVLAHIGQNQKLPTSCTGIAFGENAWVPFGCHRPFSGRE